MNASLPPPPGAENLPPVQPPPEGEAYEADLLKRRRRFSWKAFGGDGFLVSASVHLAVLIAGIFWVVSTIPEKKAVKADPLFERGGGSKGTPGNFTMSPKRPVSAPKISRLTVKGAKDARVTLPAAPMTPQSSFANSLSGGTMPGTGGAGDKGTGLGAGPGGARHFTSMPIFGTRHGPGLPGSFYDCKQLKDGAPSPYAEDAANAAFIDKVLRPMAKDWNASALERFFKAPEKLMADRLFIPEVSAEAAPKAYGVADRCKGRRWIAHYKGAVVAPKTGRFRFVGRGDDTLLVRFNSRMALDAGWTVLALPGHLANFGAKPDTARAAAQGLTGDAYPAKNPAHPSFRCGPWFDTVKGREYPVEIVLSEIPGGKFSAYLMLEEAGADNKPAGDPFLFRMSGEEVPESLVNDTGLNVDMLGRELVWRTKAAKAARVR